MHPRTVGGRELVGQTWVLGWAGSRVLQGRCVRAPIRPSYLRLYLNCYP